MDTATYKTISLKSEGVYKEKGSKFLAFAFQVTNEEEVKEALRQLRIEHPSARHHCYAWKINPENIQTRANDDGEPSSTAGKPILGQIESFGLTNVLICVIRYFGGTLLGASGLIKAYRNAAKNALEQADVIEKYVYRTRLVEVRYELLGEWMKVIKEQDWSYEHLSIGEICKLKLEIPLNEMEIFIRAESEIN